MKKGMYFSFDSFFAIFLLLTGFFVFRGFYMMGNDRVAMTEFRDVGYVAEDFSQTFSEISMREAFNTSFSNSIIEETVLTDSDLENSVVENAAVLYGSGEEEKASKIIEEFSKTIPDGYGFDVVFEDEHGREIIFGTGNREDAEVVGRSVRMVSGVSRDRAPRGYISTASISQAGAENSEYFYFGNYVGEGNISGIVELPSHDKITSVYMEADAASNFSLSINGVDAGYYNVSEQGFFADEWYVCDENLREDICQSMEEGNNLFEISFMGEEASIRGGFIRVDYNRSYSVEDSLERRSEKVDITGVEGLINQYSSFHVSGELNNISAYLKFSSEHPVFFNIANTTLFEGSSKEGETREVELESFEILESLEENGMSFENIRGSTLPFRIGMANISDLIGMEADVFSVVDVSGSMGACDVPSDEDEYDCADQCSNPGFFCCWFNDCSTESGCEECDGTFIEYGRERIKVAQEASKDFIDIVLNVTGNRVGLNAYESDVDEEDTHDLSNDSESLYSTVEGWEASGGTCICCGVYDAIDRMTEQSEDDRYKSMVVMSDGIANVDCGGGDAAQDAIDSACEAFEDHDIEVYTIGFGPTDVIDEETLQEMAECAEGEYYYASVEELEEVYENVSKDILRARYEEQRLEVRDGEIQNISLSPETSIKIEYAEEETIGQYGMLPLSFKSDRFGGEVESPKNGSFYIPGDTEVLSADMISYSSRYWVDRVKKEHEGEWKDVFSLEKFGENYEELGAPFQIGIPPEKITGGENLLSVDTGSSPDNRTGGSPYTSVVYEVLVEGGSGYGDVFERAEGGTREVDTRYGSFVLEVGNESDEWDNSSDAVNDAFDRLLDKLDVTDDGKVDFLVDEDFFEFETNVMDGLRWLWGPSRVSVEVWKE